MTPQAWITIAGIVGFCIYLFSMTREYPSSADTEDMRLIGGFSAVIAVIVCFVTLFVLGFDGIVYVPPME